MAITNIDGVPFLWDDEADSKLLGSLFPNEFMHDNFQKKTLASIVVSGDTIRDISNKVADDSGFGIGSIFSIPDKTLVETEITVNTNQGNRLIGNSSTTSNLQNDNSDQKDPYNTIWHQFEGFESKAALNNYLAGKTQPKINDTLEEQRDKKPLFMICAYVKKSTGDETTIPVYRFSAGLIKYMIQMSPEKLYAWINHWAEFDIELSEKHAGFKYWKDQLIDAYEDSMPIDIRKFVKYANVTEREKKQYDINYEFLMKAAGNPTDLKTQAAIRSLCTLLMKLDSNIIKIYNKKAVSWNDIGKRQLTIEDVIHMTKTLKELDSQIGNFNTKKFNNGDELIEFVNKYLADPSGIGEETHFVINHPFQQLTYTARKEMIWLLLDGRELGFSGFLRGVASSVNKKISRVTAGDILFTLLNTAPVPDLQKLVTALQEDRNKIFDILLASEKFLDDNDFAFNVCILLSGANKNQNVDILDLIKKGNYISFSFELRKNQTESLDTNARKIQLQNNGYYNLNISGNPHMGMIGPGASSSSIKENEKYKAEKASEKTLFDPLENVIFFAESDIDVPWLHGIQIPNEKGILETRERGLLKGDSIILPACLVYLLFKEDTNRAVNFLVQTGLAIAFLPFGVSQIVAVIRLGNTLGAIIGFIDIAADATILTYSSPQVQNNSELKEDLETLNVLAMIYTLARFTYSLKDLKTPLILRNVKKAMEQIKVEGITIERVKNLSSVNLVGKTLSIFPLSNIQIATIIFYKVGIKIYELTLQDYRICLNGVEVFKGNKSKMIAFIDDVAKNAGNDANLAHKLLVESGLDIIRKKIIVPYEGNEVYVGELLKKESLSGMETQLFYEIDKWQLGKKTRWMTGEDKDYATSIRFATHKPAADGKLILYGDVHIPKALNDAIKKEQSFLTDELFLGNAILDDGYYSLQKIAGKELDGVYGEWIVSPAYIDYGGQSINLKKVKDFMNGKDITKENLMQAAFTNFTGKWAKEKGFTKVEIVTKEAEYINLTNIEDLKGLEVIFYK